MRPSLPRWTKTAVALGAALFGFTFGIVGAELSFGVQPAPAARPPLLFSLEVRDGAGALLASPLLVGEEGRRLHLSLAPDGAGAPALMSLDLDPQPEVRGRLCLGYRLSIEGAAPHVGQLGLALGERRSLRLVGDSETLRLDVVVARAGSPAFDALLRARRSLI